MKRCKIAASFSVHALTSKFVTTTVLIFMAFCNSGCSSFNSTPLESILGANTNLINFSYNIAENLAKRAIPPLIPRHPDMPILVTTFVDNNDLEKTSHFGRVLQEHIASRLVQLGYTVREMKLSNTLKIEPRNGETILSRDLAQLNPDQEAQAILAGTISKTNKILYISARLINPINNNILATDDYQLYMDGDILSMFGLRHQNNNEKAITEPQRPLLNSIL
jgi:TolB-like protein